MMRSFLTLAIVFCVNITILAQDKATRQKHYNVNKSNLALSSYDAVSYFGGTPVKGLDKYVVYHEGVVYRFSTKKNKDLFKADPEKYAPAYGGWCAYAMGNTGEKVIVNPTTYKIIDGRLYLFYNRFLNNTLEDWNEDEKNLKRKADANWNMIIK